MKFLFFSQKYGLHDKKCETPERLLYTLYSVKTSIFKYLHIFIVSSIPTHFPTTILVVLCVGGPVLFAF